MIDMNQWRNGLLSLSTLGFVLFVAGVVLFVVGVVLLGMRLARARMRHARRSRAERRVKWTLPVVLVVLGLLMGVGGVGLQGWRVSLPVLGGQSFAEYVESRTGVASLACIVVDSDGMKDVDLDGSDIPGYDQLDCSYIDADGLPVEHALMSIDADAGTVALYDADGKPVVAE